MLRTNYYGSVLATVRFYIAGIFAHIDGGSWNLTVECLHGNIRVITNGQSSGLVSVRKKGVTSLKIDSQLSTRMCTSHTFTAKCSTHCVTASPSTVGQTRLDPSIARLGASALTDSFTLMHQ